MDSSLTVLLLEKYLPVWSSPAYFSDFLDNLCGDLVAQGAWSDLLTIFRLIRPVLNGDTLARYAYVLGRAVDLGYLTTDKPLDFLDAPNQGEKQNIARSFYTIAFSADSQGFYYKSLAAARLGESVALVPESSADTGEASENAPQNPRALAFILDFFQYGAGEFALPYAQALANTGSVSELRSIAQAFANNQRFGDSIRFASNLLSRPDHRINRKDLELLYPRPFASIIDTASERYGMAPELLYGLIRTESAFIPDVVSSAGAIGLTQLMPKTAQDVLARMERAELPTKDSDGSWNLRDPQTNVTLGAWYLRYLIHRTGSPLLALASYNGGVSRVRQWRQGQNQIPEDLFLETITIQETREYGRKVLAAAAVYGYLYYGLTMEAAVADIL
jgi:soluble lytic murein transglycosylase